MQQNQSGVVVFFFIQYFIHLCQNLMSPLPIMQLNHQHFGQRFGWVMLVAANVPLLASSRVLLMQT